MPNWVASKLVITGEDKYLTKLRDQLNAPYDSHHYNFMTNSIGHEQISGAFLLWNIVRPTNLEAYYEYEKHLKDAERRANAEPMPKLSAEELIEDLGKKLSEVTMDDFMSFREKYVKEVEVGQDWYNWNIREWGTKWEIDDAVMTQRSGELRYEFATAWSPPVQALNKLAAQYPKLIMTIRFHDEGSMFAGEIHWRNGLMEFESDIDINHGLMVEMYGYCHACSDGNENDPDYEEARAELRCAEFGQVINIEEFLK